MSPLSEMLTASKTKLRIVQEFRPKFLDSEERPHVKEVNRRFAGGEQDRAAVGPFGVVGYTMSKIDRGAFGSIGPLPTGLKAVRT
jgi:hypothetical protein